MEIWKLKFVNGRIPGKHVGKHVKDMCNLEKGNRCDCVTYGFSQVNQRNFAEKGGFRFRAKKHGRF